MALRGRDGVAWRLAHKAGAVFSRIKMKCRVGHLVNASPPKGLQRH